MIKIGLDAGHGLKTAGKQTPDGVKEWTLNDKVRDKVVKYLKPYYNVEIIYTDGDEGEVDESLSSRRKKYIDANVDVFVSIHHNAYTGNWNDATGVEVYTDKSYTEADDKLANAIYKNLPNYTGLKGRGIKRANWYVINQNKIPAILVEGGFMDSKIDYEIITSDAGQNGYAKAVAEGLIEFLGLEKRDMAETKQETPQKTNEDQKTDIKNDGKINCIFDIQEYLNRFYETNLALDNIYGSKTKSAMVLGLQKELNRQYDAGLAEDGIYGTKTKAACINVKQGASGRITYLIQMALFIKGYVIEIDGKFGNDTARIVAQFQKDNGLTVDKIVGKNTFEKLFN